jgi:hypothetical protein
VKSVNCAQPDHQATSKAIASGRMSNGCHELSFAEQERSPVSGGRRSRARGHGCTCSKRRRRSASSTIRCASGRLGFDFCKQLTFPIKRCRIVNVKILDSGDDRWIKVQVRKPGEDSSRWESGALWPGQSQRGVVSGRDRFKPAVWVDAQGLTATDVTMRLRFSGC